MPKMASEEDLARIFKRLDKSHSGAILLAELREDFARKGLSEYEIRVLLVCTISATIGTTNAIFAWFLVFEKYDKDHSGWISVAEFEEMLKAENASLSDTERKELFNRVDRDKDHKIEFKEFVKWRAGKDYPEEDDEDN